MRRLSRGFTLIELMIALVVAGILAAIAVPSYRDQMRKGRRAEAHSALMQIQTSQERFRTNNVQYASNLTAAAPVGLGLSSTSSGGNYALAIAGASATAYTATATAQAKQAGDSACAAITVTVAGATTTYGPSNACWGR